MKSRGVVIFFFAVACGNAVVPAAPPPAPLPSPPPVEDAGVSAAADAGPPVDDVAPRAAPSPKTIGDVTCATDADCAVTTRADCCECCASAPMATSRAWLSWRDGQCASTRCQPCGKVKCPYYASEGVRVVCKLQQCALR